MKRSIYKNYIFLILVLGSFLTACNNNNQPVIESTTKVEVKENKVFPFYKIIEIKPGFNFEIVSWGKGVDSLGGYLILMSDSVKNNYKSVSIERKGIIVDAWNMDLDNDGNPELYIQYKVRKIFNDVNVYEYAAGSFNKISFPGLNSINGYKGNAEFFVKNGDLYRKVPIINIDSGKTTTVIKMLKYNLRGNSFSTSEIKPD